MFKAKDVMKANVLSVTKDAPIRKAVEMQFDGKGGRRHCRQMTMVGPTVAI